MRHVNELMKLLEKYPDKPWCWDAISTNPNLTIEYIEKHPEKAWDWFAISWNPNLTIEFIEKHMDKPWDWFGISKHPNVDMEYVDAHPEKPWNWGAISNNLFTLHPAMQKRLPSVSAERRVLLQELREKFDIPPMVDERPVFKNGGVGYWEGWNTLNEWQNL